MDIVYGKAAEPKLSRNERSNTDVYPNVGTDTGFCCVTSNSINGIAGDLFESVIQDRVYT